MEAKFKSGDHVQLISGGWDMTVDHVSQNPSKTFFIVSCVWFVEGSVKRDSFNEGALKMYSAPSASESFFVG